MSFARTVSFLALLTLSLAPGRARGDEPVAAQAGVAPSEPVVPMADAPLERTMRWKWTRFQVPEYIATGALIGGTVAIALLRTPDASSNWEGPILFDKAFRNSLRLSPGGTRDTITKIGDYGYYAGLAYPVLVDVVGVALAGHRKPAVAAQMVLIDAEAYAITGFLSFAGITTIRRARPECEPIDGEARPECAGGARNASFFSGHTGIAFTGAALTCMHHAHLPLYGQSRVGGAVACGLMMAGATTVGIARMMADRHYATDVTVGAAIGLTSGFVVPWLHYRKIVKTPQIAGLNVMVLPRFSPTEAGMGAAGVF